MCHYAPIFLCHSPPTLHRTPRDDAITEALRFIDICLQHHGRDNASVNLPVVHHIHNKVDIMKHQFAFNDQRSQAQEKERLLTAEQQVVHTNVTSAVRNSRPQSFMIDAPAGTGKTFTIRAIAAHLRSENRLVLIVASTGIASLQLPGGCTAYSMFKLPLNESNVPGCVCNIPAESQRAKVLAECELIVWDEIPMAHRYSVEALDLTLKDIMANDLPFGGKCFLSAGDWRQTGPIVQYGTPADSVDAALLSSPLYEHIRTLRLTVSQRDRNDPPYAKFVRDIGEDKAERYTCLTALTALNLEPPLLIQQIPSTFGPQRRSKT